MTLANLMQVIVMDAFWSCLAALGFAVLFNVPLRLLPGCAVTGAVGHASRALLMSFGVSIEFGTLGAATIVGFTAYVLARRFRAPASIFAITGAIPMVPGVFAYRTMIGLLSIATGDPANTPVLLVEAATNAVKTGIILSAIAIGISIPTLLFQRHKPVA